MTNPLFKSRLKRNLPSDKDDHCTDMRRSHAARPCLLAPIGRPYAARDVMVALVKAWMAATELAERRPA
ncbi:MAG: hypothetical protein RL186_122 [Pseudomonadota bacterium]